MGNAHSTPHSVASDTPTAYPTVVRKQTNKKPQPFAHSFFESHIVVPVPHQHIRKPNRPAGHINFFEAASVTNGSTPSVRSQSSSKSSLKTSSTTKKSSLYPASSTVHSTRERKPSTATSSSSSSTSNSTVADQLNHLSLKTSKTDLAADSSDYVILNNRRYWKGHGSQTFILPCDDDESDRLMTLHYILKSTFHGNFTAPVYQMLNSEKHITKVLDIGCGSGTWILEMATEFPNTEFYGVDDCPLFPTHIKPGNSHFKLHNVLKGLPFQDNEFDFVHMRMMVFYFTPEELSQLLTEVSRVMKPGAYFEMIDSNYTVCRAGPITNKIINTDMIQMLHSVPASSTLPQHESNATHPIFDFLMLAPQDLSSCFVGNFIDICQEHSTLPIGCWSGGQIGDLHSKNFQSLLLSIESKQSGQQLPFTKDTVDSIIEECEKHKSYLDWFACYARKPPAGEEGIEQSTLDSIYEFVEGFVDV